MRDIYFPMPAEITEVGEIGTGPDDSTAEVEGSGTGPDDPTVTPSDSYHQLLLECDQDLQQNAIDTSIAKADLDALEVKKARVEAMDPNEFEAKAAEQREMIVAKQTELHARYVGNVFLAHSFLTTGAPRVAGSTSIQALIKALIVAKVYGWNQGYDLMSEEVQSATEIPALLNAHDPNGTVAKAFAAGLAKVESILPPAMQSSVARTKTEEKSDSEKISYFHLKHVMDAVMSVYRADLLETNPQRAGQIDCQLLFDAKDDIPHEDAENNLVVFEFRKNVVVLTDIASKVDGSEGDDAAIQVAHLLALELSGDDESLGLAMLAMETNMLGGRDFHNISTEEMTKFVTDSAVVLHDGVTMAEMRAYITPKNEDSISSQYRCLLLLFDEMSAVTDLYVKEDYDASLTHVVNAMLVEISEVRRALVRGISNAVQEELKRRSRNLSSADTAASGLITNIDSLIKVQETKLEEKNTQITGIDEKIAEREDDKSAVKGITEKEITDVNKELKGIQEAVTAKQIEVEELREATKSANDALTDAFEQAENATDVLAQLYEHERQLQKKHNEASQALLDAENADINAAAAEEALTGELAETSKLAADVNAELKNQQDWIKFVKAIHNAFTTDPQVMTQRKTTRDALEAKMDEFMMSESVIGFDWVFEILESCQGLFKEGSNVLSPEALERWRGLEKENEFYSIDLYNVCDNVLGTNTELYFNESAQLVAHVAGAGLSWKEVKEDIEKKIHSRLYFAGLEFDSEGKLQLRYPWSEFKWADIRECSQALYTMMERRFKTFFQDKTPENHKKWIALREDITGEEMNQNLLDLNKWRAEPNDGHGDYAIRMEDVMRCFARKIQAIAQHDMVYDNNVKIPGIDLSTCSGREGSIHFNVSSKDSFTIDTSGNQLRKFFKERAVHGKVYDTGTQTGHDGDQGTNGLAGMHGGHVLVQAGKFEGIEKIKKILANGASGLKAQKGGHGGEGKEGLGGKPAKATPIDTWSSAEFRIASAHYPGLSGDDNMPDRKKRNEWPGRGGNGGLSGRSGPSGYGGNVTFAKQHDVVFAKAYDGTHHETTIGFDGADHLNGCVENVQPEPILDTAADNDAIGGKGGKPGLAGQMIQWRKEGFLWSAGKKNSKHGNSKKGYFEPYEDKYRGGPSAGDLAAGGLLSAAVGACIWGSYRKVSHHKYTDTAEKAYREETEVNGTCPEDPDWIPKMDEEQIVHAHSHENGIGKRGASAAEVAEQMEANAEPDDGPDEAEQRNEQNVGGELSQMQNIASAIGKEKDSVLNEMLNGYATRADSLRNESDQLASKGAELQQELDQAKIHHQETSELLKTTESAFNDIDAQLTETQNAIEAAEEHSEEMITASLAAFEEAMSALEAQQAAELALALTKVEEGNVQLQLTIVQSLEGSTLAAIQSSVDALQREKETAEQEIQAVQQTITQMQQQQQSAEVVVHANGNAGAPLQQALGLLNQTITQNKTVEATTELRAEADSSGFVSSLALDKRGQKSKPDRRIFFAKREMALAANETVGDAFCLYHVQQAHGDAEGSVQDVEQTMAQLSALVDCASESEVNAKVGTAFALQTLELIVRYASVDKQIFDLLDIPIGSCSLTDLFEALQNFNVKWFKITCDDVGFRNLMRGVNRYEGHPSGIFKLQRVGFHIKYAHYRGEYDLTDLDQQILDYVEIIMRGDDDVFAPLQALVTSYGAEVAKVYRQEAEPDTHETGLLALILGRVSAFKSGVVQLIETWATTEGTKSLLVHELEVEGILSSVEQIQDLATSTETEALNLRIQHLSIQIAQANELSNVSLYQPCFGTNIQNLETAFNAFLKALSPEEITTALNDMTKILNEIDEAASDPSWPGEYFASKNWEHVQEVSKSQEVQKAFTGWSMATTEQYLRSLGYDDALLQIVREALRYREDVVGVDFAGVLRRKAAFLEMLKTLEIDQMSLGNILKAVKIVYPLPPSPDVLDQSRKLLFELYVELYSEEVKNADPALTYEVLYEVTLFTLVKRAYADLSSTANESARSASKGRVETLRKNLSGVNGVLSLALDFEGQYYMQFTQLLAMKKDAINEIAKMIQDSLAFQRNVPTVAVDDEEFLRLLGNAIYPDTSTNETLQKMWNESFSAMGADSAIISQAVMEAALILPPAEWDFLLEVESLNQMPATCYDILALHIATACLQAGETVADTTANRSLGVNYTKYVVATAQAFMEHVVAAEVLCQRHFQTDPSDKSWTENASNFLKRAVATVELVEQATANAKAQFKQVQQRMTTHCRHECNIKVGDRLDARLTGIYMNHIQYAEIKVELVAVPDEDWNSLPQGAHLGVEHVLGTFIEGAQIEARIAEEGEWGAGVITKVNGDGTYDIQCLGDKIERGVFGAYIRVPAPAFALGTKIEGKWREEAVADAWSPGSIVGVNSDETFNIDYDDGTSSRDVNKQHIRVLERVFALGTKVEGNQKNNKWSPGSIAGLNVDRTFNISYDDSTFERDVSEENIRVDTPIFALGSSVEFQTKSSNADTWTGGVIVGVNAGATFDIKFNTAKGEVVEQNVVSKNIKSDAGESGAQVTATAFALGSHIEAKKNKDPNTGRVTTSTSWYSGSVAGVNMDGTYNITYNDGNSARDVLETNIRATTPAFALGSQVQGKWGGRDKWYSGTIAGVNADDTFAIKYENGKFEPNVSAQYVKAITPTFALGSNIEAKYEGEEKWSPGVIVGVNKDGSYGVNNDGDGKSELSVLVENIRVPLSTEDVSEFWSDVTENTASIQVPRQSILDALTWLSAVSPPTTNTLEVWMCLTNVFMVPPSPITAEHYSTHTSVCNAYVKLKKNKWEAETEGRAETTIPSGTTITAHEEREDLLGRFTSLGENMGLELLSRIADRKSTSMRTAFEKYEAEITAVVEQLALSDKKMNRLSRHIRQQNFIEYTLRKLNDYWFTGLIDGASLEAVLLEAKQMLDEDGDADFGKQVSMLEEYLVAEVNKMGSYNLMAMAASLDTTDIREDMKHIVFKLGTSIDVQSGLKQFVIGDGSEKSENLFNCAKDMLLIDPKFWEKSGGKYNRNAYLAAARVFNKLAEACGLGFGDIFNASTTALVWYWNLEECMVLYPDGTMWARSCTTDGTWSRDGQTITIKWANKGAITVQVSDSGRHLIGKEQNGSGANFVQAVAIPCAELLLLDDSDQVRTMRKTIDTTLNHFRSDLADVVPAHAVTLAESVSKVVEALLKGCYRELDWRHGTMILEERTPALDTTIEAMTVLYALAERRLLSFQTLDTVLLTDTPQASTDECQAPKFVEECGEFKSVNDPWPLKVFDPSSVIESNEPSNAAAVAIVYAWSEKLQLSFVEIFKNLILIYPFDGPPDNDDILSMIIDLLARNTQAWTAEHKVRDLILHHDEDMKSRILSLSFALQQCSGLPELGFNPTDTTAAWRAVLASEEHCNAIDMAFAGDCTLLINSKAAENLRLYMNDALATVVGSFENPTAIWDLGLKAPGVERFSKHMRYYGDTELVQAVLEAKNDEKEDHLTETQKRLLDSAEKLSADETIDELAFAHLELYLTLTAWIVSERSKGASAIAEGAALEGVNGSADVLRRLVGRAKLSVQTVKESPDALLDVTQDRLIQIDLFSLLRVLLDVSPKAMTDPNRMLNKFLETQTPKPNTLCLDALLSNVEKSFVDSADGAIDLEQVLKSSTGEYVWSIEWEHKLSEAFFSLVSSVLIDSPRLRTLETDMVKLIPEEKDQGYVTEYLTHAVERFDAVLTTNDLDDLNTHYKGTLFNLELARGIADGVSEAQELCDLAKEEVLQARSVHESLIALASIAREENHMREYANILGQFMRDSISLDNASHMIYLMRKEGISAVHTALKSIAESKEDTSVTTFVWDLFEYFVRKSFETITSTYNHQEPVGLIEAIDELMAAASSSEGGLLFVKILYTSLQSYRSLQSNQLGAVIVRKIVDLCVQTSVYEKCAGPYGLVARKLVNTVFPSWRVFLRTILVHQRLGSKADKAVEEHIRVFEKRNGVILCNLMVGMLSHLHITVGNTRVLTERLANNRWQFDKEDTKTTQDIEDEDHWMYVCKLYERRRKKAEGTRDIPRLLQIMIDDPRNESISYFLQNNSETDEYDLEKLLQKTKAYFNYEGVFEVTAADGSISKPAAVTFEKEDILAAASAIKADLKLVNREIRDHQCWLAALLARTVDLIEGWPFPTGGCPIRDVQLMAYFLFIDSFSADGRLANIGTGEGKSLIVQMLAIARVLEGKTVDCITSNTVLAERDAKAAEEIFSYFDVSVSNNCDAKANANMDSRKSRYDSDVVYGDTASFQRDILLTLFFNKEIRDAVAPALIVDEVDSMFIDSAETTLYISHNIEDLRYLDSILVNIWTAVATGADTQEFNEYNVQMIESFILQKMADNDDDCLVPNKLVDFAKARLRIWINSAYTAKFMNASEEYSILESGRNQGKAVVMDLNTGVEQMNTQWSNGLHQFVQLKHLNKLTSVSLKAVFSSNMSFFRLYGANIIGMTGTVGDEVEMDLMEEIYLCDTFRLPRFMEERYYELPSITGLTTRVWLDRIKDEVCTIALGLDDNVSELDYQIELELTRDILLEVGISPEDITPVLLKAVIEEHKEIKEIATEETDIDMLTKEDLPDLVKDLTAQIEGVTDVVQTVANDSELTLAQIEAAGVVKPDDLVNDQQKPTLLPYEQVVFQAVKRANPKPETPHDLQHLVDVALNVAYVDIEKAYDQVDVLTEQMEIVNTELEAEKKAASDCLALADKLQKVSFALLTGSAEYMYADPESEQNPVNGGASTVSGANARAIITDTLDLVEEMGVDVRGEEGKDDTGDVDCKKFIKELEDIEDLLTANIISNPEKPADITHNQQVEKKCAEQARPVASKLLQRCAKLLTKEARGHADQAAIKEATVKGLLKDIDKVESNIRELKDQQAELKGRGVLIICPDQRHVKQIVDKLLRHLPELYRYQTSADGVARITTDGIQEQNLTPDDVKMRPGTVVVATNIAGRGTNFKPSDLCESNGGVHVLLAYIPDNARVELQAWGRTARSGKAGTGRFVVRSPDGASAAEKVERRDEREAERLEVIRKETLPKLMAEEELLDKFEAALEAMYKPPTPTNFEGDEEAKRNFNSLQQKSFMDNWAIWLDSQMDRIANVYKDESSRKASLFEDFDTWFASTQEEAQSNSEAYVVSTGEQTKLIALYMQQENWTKASELSFKVIKEDPDFSGIAHLYASMALIGAKQNDMRIEAISHIETALFLLNRECEKLGNHISIVETAQAYLFDQRIGGSVDFFRQSRGNEQMLLYRHMQTASECSGQPVKPDSFARVTYITEDTAAQETLFRTLVENGYLKDEHVSKSLEVYYRVQNPSQSVNDRAYQLLADGSVLVDLTDQQMAALDPQPQRVGLVPNPATGILEPIILPSKFQYFEDYLWKILGDAKDRSFESIRPKLDDLLLSVEDVMAALDPMITSEDCFCFDEDYDENKTGEWEEEALVGRDGLKAALAEMKELNGGKYFDMEDLLHACIDNTDECFTEEEVSDEQKQKAVVDALDALVQKGLLHAIKRYIFKKDICDTVKHYQTTLVDPDMEKVETLDLSPYPVLEDYEDEIIKAIKDCEEKGELFEVAHLEDMTEFRCKQEDFDVLRALLAPPLVDVLGAKDAVIKNALDTVRTHEMMIEVIIITFVNLQVAGSKGFIEKELGAQLSTVEELQSVLKVERVLKPARVDFYLDYFGDHEASDQFTGKTPHEKFEDFTSSINDWMTDAYLRNELGLNPVPEILETSGVAGGAMGSEPEMVPDTAAINERIAACISETISVLETCIGTIRILDQIIPDPTSLEDQFQDQDVNPPEELSEFTRRATHLQCKFDEKKNWWPTWEEIVIVVIGIAQVVAGVLLTIFTAGIGVQIGAMLISEGISDIVVGLSSWLLGTGITMQSYARGKAISVTLTIATSGLGTILKVGDEATRLVTGLTKTMSTGKRVWTVTKAATKEIAKHFSKAMVNASINVSATKFSEMLTDLVWNEFESSFTDWVLESKAYRRRKEEMETEMRLVYTKFGQTTGDAIVQRAIEQARQTYDSLLNQVEYLVIDSCLNLNNRLNKKSQGMKPSKSGYSSVLGSVQRIFTVAVQSWAVVKPLKDIAELPAEFMDAVTEHMTNLRNEMLVPTNPTPPNNLDEYITEKMEGPDGVITAIMNEIKLKVQTTLVQPTAQRAIEKGSSAVYERVNPDSGSLKQVQEDNEKVKVVAMRQINEYEDINPPNKPNTADEVGVPDVSGTTPHTSSVIDSPGNNPQLVVKDYGEETTLGEVKARDMSDNNGLKLMEGESGTYHVLRKDYQASIDDGFKLDKRTNKSELAAFSETSNMQIKVVDNDGKVSFVHPSGATDKPVLHVMLLKTDNNPEGFYTTVVPHTTTPWKDISDIDNFDKNFASQMVYHQAKRLGNNHADAVEIANDPAEVQLYLNRAKRIATTSPGLKTVFRPRDQTGEIDNFMTTVTLYAPIFNYGYPGYLTLGAWNEVLQAILDGIEQKQGSSDGEEGEMQVEEENARVVRHGVTKSDNSLGIFDTVTARTDYDAMEVGELSFSQGDVIKVIGVYEGSDWIVGYNISSGEEGLLHPSLVTKTVSISAIEPFDTVTADVAYDAAEDGELSLKKGDAIEVIAVYEGSDWTTGKKVTTGEEGFFYDKLVTKMAKTPANKAFIYLNVGDTLVADESYTARADNELSYEKDDVLTVAHTYYTDGNNSAWVSACDVRDLQQPAMYTSLVHPKNFVKTAAASTAFKVTALTTSGEGALPKVNDTVTAEQGCRTDNRDELSFSKGDVIKVLEVNDGQEWVYGKSLETGEEGSFFMKYVTIDANPDIREPPLEPLRAGDPVLANRDYEGTDASELSFHKAEEIVITEVNFADERVTGKSLETGKVGLVDPKYVTKTLEAVGLDTDIEADSTQSGVEGNEEEGAPPEVLLQVGDTVKAIQDSPVGDVLELTYKKDDEIEVVEVYDGYDWVGGKLKTGDGVIGLFNPTNVTKIASTAKPSAGTLKPHDIVTVIVDYLETADSTELVLKKGDDIEVDYVLERYGMLWGTSKSTNETGYFLSSQVELKTSGN